MNKKKLTGLIILILILAPLLLSGYLYYRLHTIKNIPNVSVQEEAKDLLTKVSKLYLLPNNEDPTVATVSDPSILKDQSFFILSEKGDKVLIFNKAGKAVLYRPSLNKIIEIAPIKNNSINPNEKPEEKPFEF